jgi:hypothetical protein
VDASLVDVYLIFLMGVLGVIITLGINRRQERAVGFILSALIVVSAFWLFANNVRSYVGPEGPSPEEVARAESLARAEVENTPRAQYQEFALDMLGQLSNVQLDLSNFWNLDWRTRRDKVEAVRTLKTNMESQFTANPPPFPDFQQSRIEITACFTAVDNALKSYGSYLYHAEDEYDEGMASAKYQFNKAVEELGASIAQATSLVQQYK